MAHLITTLGPKSLDEIGPMLPHEHVFVDLRTPDQPGYAEASPDEVVRVMSPRIEELKAAGFGALVECSTTGVGRRADIDMAVSEATGFPIVVPTGIYREPWIPAWVRDATPAALSEWMSDELAGGIEKSGVIAGWIKLSAGDDGMTELERTILGAAARAARGHNATIGSHTIRARVVMDQLDVIEHEGCDPARFISIHTQLEPDFEQHLAVARRGAWIEYDSIGRDDDDELIAMISRVLDAGFGDRLLLSHDTGWYDPAQPGGGTQQPYTYLAETFLPKMRAAGIDEATIDRLTRLNPFNAFAR